MNDLMPKGEAEALVTLIKNAHPSLNVELSSPLYRHNVDRADDVTYYVVIHYGPPSKYGLTSRCIIINDIKHWEAFEEIACLIAQGVEDANRTEV